MKTDCHSFGRASWALFPPPSASTRRLPRRVLYTCTTTRRAMADSPEQIATDLRDIARENVACIPECRAEETQEWRAAQMIETAVGALREIKSGVPEPRIVATVALMEMNDG